MDFPRIVPISFVGHSQRIDGKVNGDRSSGPSRRRRFGLDLFGHPDRHLFCSDDTQLIHHVDLSF